MKKLFISLFILTFVIASCSDSNKETLEYSGTIETLDLVVSSQIMGKVNSLLFDEGDLVEKGDTLAVINHKKFDLQLIQAEAKRNAIKIQINMLSKGARKEDKKMVSEGLKQAKANLEIVEKNKERMEKLLDAESITQKQYDDAILAYDVAKSRYISAKQNVKKSKTARPEQIELLKENLKQADATVGIIKQNLNDCYILSPISGQITNRFVEEGEVVSFMSSIFKIIDLSKTELTVYVPEADLAFINLGEKTNINIDGINDKYFDGKISFISPEAEFTPKNIQTKDERTKLVFAVKMQIDNSSRMLKTGMPADAIIKIEQ